jgi:hypothetical protein
MNDSIRSSGCGQGLPASIRDGTYHGLWVIGTNGDDLEVSVDFSDLGRWVVCGRFAGDLSVMGCVLECGAPLLGGRGEWFWELMSKIGPLDPCWIVARYGIIVGDAISRQRSFFLDGFALYVRNVRNATS